VRPLNFWVPLFALVAIAVVGPPYLHFLGMLSSQPAHIQFLAGLTLPSLVILLGASWLQPGGAA
jgi:hypothetical protein